MCSEIMATMKDYWRILQSFTRGWHNVVTLYWPLLLMLNHRRHSQFSFMLFLHDFSCLKICTTHECVQSWYLWSYLPDLQTLFRSVRRHNLSMKKCLRQQEGQHSKFLPGPPGSCALKLPTHLNRIWNMSVVCYIMVFMHKGVNSCVPLAAPAMSCDVCMIWRKLYEEIIYKHSNW